MRLAVAILLLFVPMSLPLSCEPNSSDQVEKASVAKLRDFEKFDLYYLGRSFAGERLTSAECSGKAPECLFGYGTCDASPDGLFDDSGCALPLDLQNRSICARFPALFRPVPEITEVAGATVSSFDGIDIHTGETTITVYGAKKVGGVERVIANLRSVRTGRKVKDLPPPVPGAIAGELECQQSRLDRYDRSVLQRTPMQATTGSTQSSMR